MRILTTFLLLTLIFSLLHSGGVFGQPIQGPSTVYSGGQSTFTYDDGNSYLGTYWTTSIGATTISSGQNGTQYYATIEWTVNPGSGAVSFQDESFNIGFTHNVTIVPCFSPVEVGGGGLYCTQGLSVSVATQTNASYQLVLLPGIGNIGPSVAGTGGGITWNNLTTPGTYYVRASNHLGQCTVTLPGSATITQGTMPTIYSVQGGGGYCDGSTGPSITLNGSQNIFTYHLYRDGNLVSSLGGTGSPLTWSNITTQGNYVVTATPNFPDGCSAQMASSVSVTQNPLPQFYSVGGGGFYCSPTVNGVAVTLNGSQNGVNYQLKINGNNSGSPIAGNGGALTWNSQTSAGTYTVVAVNASTGCFRSMDGFATVSLGTTPTAFNVQGGGAYCSGSTAPSITLSGSQGGVTYSLYRNGSTFVSSQGGTGSPLSWTNNSTAGTYSITASHISGCSNSMAGTAQVTVNPLPQLYNVGGGGAYCSPGENGVAITLNGSESNTNYQLKLNGGNIGSPVPGNGSSLSWPSQTAAGTYTVAAVNPNTGCGRSMAGSSSVSILEGAVGGSMTALVNEVYAGTNSDNVTLSGYSQTIDRWQRNEGAGWIDIAYTNPQRSFENLNITTQYRAIVTASSSCPAVPSSAVTITVYPIPVVSGPTVLPYGGMIQLSTQSSYYSYQWYRNGQIISGATSYQLNVSTPGSYLVKVKGSASAPEYTSGALTVSNPVDAQPPINFHKVITHKQAGHTSVPDTYTLGRDKFAENIVYMDGLGRAIQEVAEAQSPTQNDIVAPKTFDEHGRASTQYLPYAEASSTGIYRPEALAGTGGYLQSQQYLFYQGASSVAQSTAPFATTAYDNSPLARATEQGAPGTDWQPGTGHTLRFSWHVNDQQAAAPAGIKNVLKWTTAGPTGSFYGNGDLLVSKGINESGNETFVFTDKLGRTILKRVQLDETIETTTVPYLDTYFVYDHRGNMVMQIPPRAVAKLSSGTSWTTVFRDEWCFVYTYDHLNRLVEKKTPGAVAIYYGYDRLDRLVLHQDGNLRNENKWFFTKYDALNRAVMQGIYTNTTHTTRTAIQENVLDPLYANTNDPYYEVRSTAGHGYTNQSFPVANTEILSVNYYDHYDFDGNGVADYSYTAQSISGEGAQGSAFGLPTGSKQVILGSGTWLYRYIFYDKFGRVIQSRSNNHLSLAIDNLVTNVYDFEGKVLLTKNYHNAGGTNQTTIVNKFVYDHAGRILAVYQNNNGAPRDQVVAAYNYNELGQLVEKNLHCKDCADLEPLADQAGTIYGDVIERDVYHQNESRLVAKTRIRLKKGYRVPNANSVKMKIGLNSADYNAQFTDGDNFLQSVDYRYNIRGWLESINNSALTVDARNDDAGDYFGMELLYEDTEAGLGNTAHYNGNISAIKWKGIGSQSGSEDQRSYKYVYDKTDKLRQALFQAHDGTAWNSETGTLNETMRYDHNGNILDLQRYQNQRGLSGLTVTSTPQVMDNIAYTYALGQGNQLTKAEDNSNDPLGFKNGDNSTTEYIYNTDGSLTADRNKGIDSVHYNVIGQVRRIKFSDGKAIAYSYDAAGNKLVQKLYDGGTPQNTTDYVEGFVYENGSLSFFGSPEGRVVKNGNDLEYQYAISDHQGNTRVIFSAETPAPVEHLATFEYPVADNLKFENVPEASPYWASYIAANNTPAGNKVVRMNQNFNIGPAKSLKVYPGDKVDMEVWTHFENATGFGTTAAPLAALVTNVAGAFGGVNGGAGESGAIYDGVNNALGGFGMGGSQGDAAPGAYLNYILFDQNYKVLNAGWQVVPPSALNTKQKINIPQVSVKEAGFIFVFLSYESESNNYVQFDDFKVTHTKTNVIQYNEYYPFGLQTSNSWTRQGSANNFLYNEGNELNRISGWFETFFRGYDPALGRFTSVDPLAFIVPDYSPYTYANNNPVLLNDPLGLLASWDEYWSVVGTLYAHESGGYWSESSGTRKFDSGMEAFYAGAGYMDAYGMWGDAGGATSFESAAQNYSHDTGEPVPLRGVTISAHQNPYGDGLAFSGEPYYDPHNWLHKRLNETFIDYDAWLKSQTDKLQSILDKGGLIPGAGELFDGLNAVIYLARGDQAMAAVSAAAALPVLGWLASGAKNGAKLLTQGAKALHKHHVLPQTFRSWFKSRGITDIDNFTILLSEATHLRGVHGKGLGNLPGQWNQNWADFITANPKATPSQIFHYAEGLLRTYGLEHLPYRPY